MRYFIPLLFPFAIYLMFGFIVGYNVEYWSINTKVIYTMIYSAVIFFYYIVLFINKKPN